jgi:hypothetical protein
MKPTKNKKRFFVRNKIQKIKNGIKLKGIGLKLNLQ